jgi:hypothetical protein
MRRRRRRRRTEHSRTLGRDTRATRSPVWLKRASAETNKLSAERRVAVRGSMRRNESRTRGPSYVRPVCT